MTKAAIGAMLEARGLKRVAHKLAASVKPSIRLRASGKEEGPVTRLGGRPNLPVELKWPRPNGEPLAFIAQVDLAALPPVRGIGRPDSGTLYFFYEGAGGLWAVCYLQHSLKEFALRRFPKDLELRLQSVPLALAAVEPTMPNRSDHLLWKMGLTEEESDLYEDFLREWAQHRYGRTGIHCLGGYPDLIQESDPKLEAQWESNGADTASDQERLAGGAVDWRLLFQVDSELDAGISWGDAGKLYFLIHKDDLRNRKFSESWLISQFS